MLLKNFSKNIMTFVESMTFVVNKLKKDKFKETQKELDEIQKYIEEQYLTGSVLFLPEAENKFKEALKKIKQNDKLNPQKTLEIFEEIRVLLVNFSSYKMILLSQLREQDHTTIANTKKELEKILKELLSLLNINL